MFFQIPFFGVQLPDQRGLVHGSGFVAQNNSQNANCFCLLICCVLRIVLDGIFRVEETTMCHVSFDMWENLGYNRRVHLMKGNKMGQKIIEPNSPFEKLGDHLELAYRRGELLGYKKAMFELAKLENELEKAIEKMEGNLNVKD
tara:strand:+ start:122 stop:553 length:432 start_codon:yes stop_codon:yes gene_type:complete